MVLLDFADRASVVDDLPADFETGSPCPNCGSTQTYVGFGLAGGGMGAYGSCDDCFWFGKTPASTEGGG